MVPDLLDPPDHEDNLDPPDLSAQAVDQDLRDREESPETREPRDLLVLREKLDRGARLDCRDQVDLLEDPGLPVNPAHLDPADKGVNIVP